MHLEELRLLAYGPFTDCTLRLQPGLNVLYGPNEAGKSSALRAVHALLFGVEERTNDNFVHSYPQLRVGGLLVDGQGQQIQCVRRKGRRSTLRCGGDDEPIDEALITTMLDGVNAEFFGSVFGIDHERLRQGGEQVLRGEGRVGALLFAAGGVSQLREKQQALESAAAELFKPSGRNPRINTALSQLRELNEQIRDLQRSPEAWARHDAEHQRLVKEEGRIRRELAAAEGVRSRLDRIHKALGFVGTWRQKQSELDSLADVVALPDDADQRFRDANQKRTLAEAAVRTATGRVETFQAELDALPVPIALLGEEDRIDELYRRLGSHEKAAADSVVLAGQQRTARAGAKRTLEKLGWELSLDEARKRRVAEDKKSLVRALANRHAEARQGKERCQQSLDRARERLAELQQQRATAPEAEDSTALKRTLLAVTPLLEVEDQLGAQREQVERMQHEANDALARLPMWNGVLEDACRLVTPSEETIDQFEQTTRSLASEHAKVAELLDSNQANQEQANQELAALELAESVPTEEELSRLRTLRDRGVRLASQYLRGEEANPDEVDAFVNDTGAGVDLAASLEPSVRQADEVADRLRRESNRVAQKSQLLARLQTLGAESQRLNEKLSTVEIQLTKWETDWRMRWEAARIEPATPSEMRGWLRKQLQVVTLARELNSATLQLARNEERVASHITSLRSELAGLDVVVPEPANLRCLMQFAQERIEAIETAGRKLANLDAEVARVSEEIRQAEKDVASAESELNAWLSDWKAALVPLGLEPDALPAQAETVLANLDELFRNLDEAENYHNRIWGIEQTAKEFTQASVEMAAAVAPDLADLPVEKLVATLNQRLGDAKQARQHSASLQQRLATEQELIDQANNDLSDCSAAMAALVTEAACEGAAELPAAIEKSRIKKTLEAELTQLEAQLAPVCAGQPLAEFVTDALQEDADQLPNRIAELETQVAGLRGELEATIAAKERESGELRQFDGSAAAAEKANERQAVLARLEDDAREFVVTAVAGRLLQQAVERYQQKTQAPVLTGASTYFQKLTGGSFDGLKTDYDESGVEVVVGMRPDGSPLSVEGMSEGTRDQLYLALRLGTLDHWFDEHDTVPFIVDDVLLTFDDARAAATLEVLAEMAGRNQVLFFTHHEHLVELARSVCRNNGLKGVNIVMGWEA